MILNSAQFTFTAGWQEYIMMALYFIVLIIIGLYAYKQSTSDLSGYMLGGRNIGPWVTALSAGASDMSGWMLMGLPGSMYSVGLSSIWIAIGLTIGAYINYWVVAPRLRVYSEVSEDSITLPDFFENRFKDNKHILKIVSGLVIVIFFAVYTASGMVSGGKLFQSAFDVPYHWGLFVTAAVVVVYTFVGGYLAVSLTDFFQGTIMFIAIVLIPIVAWMNLTGQGVEPFVRIEDLGAAADVNYLSFISGVSIITILSNLAWGFGYFGQPHIIVRFMSIRSHKIIPKARRIGITWMSIALVGACLTGLLGIAFTDATANDVADPETILILMSQVLFHPLIGGFFLAAILAAIMSTISSQLLVTSSSLVQDFYKIMRRKTVDKETKSKEELDKHFVLLGRLSVVLVAIVAIIIAWDDESVILNIVANAWAGFGAAFGPLVVLSLHWKGLTRAGAVAAIIGGAATVIIWIAAGGFGTGLYEIIPGVIVSTLAAIIVSKMTQGTGISKEMEAEFDETTNILKQSK
ncbi:sodium/proline symporter PutP [Salinicoccus roseus]|uniref:Sodium/proline symporter n=1 Tax=Salinicoccus roseus TaxID=45670 RepID=A0A265E517_9STAP|nr:sodium/proline symporter PutP [Salinicoccus roseus]MBY8908905.1 sodium/proline symporter PutP [Salinicoccus roseus]OZT76620.1 sodium/proline symporter [Salinicoccus roseus]